MTYAATETHRDALSRYSEELLEATAARAARTTRSKRTGTPAEQIAKMLSNPRAVSKLVASVDEPAQLALAILKRSPYVRWRWDHALALLNALGIAAPSLVLQDLLATGLIWMRRARSNDPLTRFEVPSGMPMESLPSIMIASPLIEQSLDLPELPSPLTPHQATSAWRIADGWEWPTRLAVLWQLAWLAPIKRTQQRILFKKDRERLTEHSLLAADTLDAHVKIPEPGILTYHLAMDQGWLDPFEDEQSPSSPLSQVWPQELSDLLLLCGRGLLTLEGWNELGPHAPVGSFSTDVIPARFLCLLWLSGLDGESGARIEEIAAELEANVPPWNGEGELTGAMRTPKDRHRLCREWAKATLFGPLYQGELVEIADAESPNPLVRLSPIGRRFLGFPVELPAPPKFPQTLFVQPNHQVIVYRQAMSVELLIQLLLFAEAKSAGAALTLEISPASIYHGLEAGMDAPRIIEALKVNSGRPLPSGVEQSILTWSEKRDRLTIHQDASLFEFATPEDLQDAIAKGLSATALTDRIALVEGSEGAFKNLRITASRDYRLDPEPCVETAPDGITLRVDLEKSDLLLESELLRLADPLPAADRSTRRQFVISKESLERAFEQGLGGEFIEQWFKLRTGEEPPKSVRLLLRAVTGLELTAREVMVVSVESPLVAEGLLQHPLTADLFQERLGPSTLSVEAAKLDTLRERLVEIGVELIIRAH